MNLYGEHDFRQRRTHLRSEIGSAPMCRKEPLRQLLGVKPLDTHALATRTGAGEEMYRAPRHVEPPGEKTNQLLVRGAIDGRCFDTNLDGVTVTPYHLGPRGSRLDVESDGVSPAQKRPSSPLTRSRTMNHATNGVMSIIPRGGMTLRNGLTIQSVSR